MNINLALEIDENIIGLIREITGRPKNADVSDITLHQSVVVMAGRVQIKEGDLVLLNK